MRAGIIDQISAAPQATTYLRKLSDRGGEVVKCGEAPARATALIATPTPRSRSR
jgi:hypothetical protein